MIAACEKLPFTVKSIESKEVKRSPTPPFITSRLQQEAARKLYFSPSRTMKIAQRLYEGVELGEAGATGLITYMRTDSPRVSPQALDMVRGYIANRYGKEYLPDHANFYKGSKSSQDAHEAIRPTSTERDPDSIAQYLDKDELALYTLIFNRFVSSQMVPAVFDRTTIDIESGDAIFRATGQVMKFDGFMRVYIEGQDEPEEQEGMLPQLSEGEILKLLGFDPEQHFTQPPPRFSQATLIKELEEKGIGRPSTYVSIMNSLTKVYVEEDDSKRLRPTSLGRVVSDLLVTGFPDVLEVGFTAKLENELDDVEEGRDGWVPTLHRFWKPFEKRLGEAQDQHARGQAHRREDRSHLRARRRRDGHQMGPQRRIPRVLQLSGMPQHQGIQARRSGRHPDRRNPSAATMTDVTCDKVRQADGAQALALRRVPRMLRLSRLRRHQEAEGRADPYRRQLPRMQRGRDARASHAARQDFLGMRPLSEVQIRELGQSHPAALPDLRRAIPGGESHQEGRRAMAMRQGRLRLSDPGSGERAPSFDAAGLRQRDRLRRPPGYVAREAKPPQ